MKIAVMGAGAVGAYVGGRLAQSGNDVTLIARGAHLAALREKGLVIDSPLGAVDGLAISATDNPDEIGPVDIVLFAVKMWDTETAAQSLAPMLSPETRVVTLQNGIDSVDAISRHVGPDQVVGAVIYLGVAIASPGVIYNPGGTHQIILGDHNGDPGIAGFAAALEEAPAIGATISTNVRRTIWEKFIRLVALSASTALTRKCIGDVLGNPVTRSYFVALLEEVAAVANAEGQDFGQDDIDTGLAFFESLPPSFKASMLEDLENGRRLELPWLSSRVCELADAHGISVPANKAAHWGLTLHKDGAHPA